MENRLILITFLLVIFSCSKKKEVNITMPPEEHKSMNSFKISAPQMKLANIKVEPIRMKDISEEVLLSGSLVPDENKSSQINSPIMGRIDKLYFKFTGENIRKGDLLYEIYSEDLQSVQRDYILASQKSENHSKDYINQFKESAKNKLLLWGLTDKQVSELEQTKDISLTTKIYSNSSGIISDILIHEGDYVMQGAPLFRISDLSSLWVEAQLYSSEVSSVKNGDVAEIFIEGLNGKIFNSRISFVTPELNSNSIVNIIRAEIKNADMFLKPGMLATVRVKTKSVNTLVLPVDAVLQDAKGSSVWIQNADGSFESKMVMTGISNNEEVEITMGLENGEKVVVTGAFLINSEFKLKRDADPMGGMKM